MKLDTKRVKGARRGPLYSESAGVVVGWVIVEEITERTERDE